MFLLWKTSTWERRGLSGWFLFFLFLGLRPTNRCTRRVASNPRCLVFPQVRLVMDFLTATISSALIISAGSENGRRKVLASLLIGLTIFFATRVSGTILDHLTRVVINSGVAAILLEAAIVVVKRRQSAALVQMLALIWLVLTSGLLVEWAEKLNTIRRSEERR